jgi:hypothetical protein
MIQVKIKKFNDAHFYEALSKLASCPTFPVKQAYTIGKIKDKVMQEEKNVRKLFNQVVEKHAITGEDGKPKQVEGAAPGTFGIKEESKEAYQQEFMDLLETAIEIKYEQLSLSQVELAVAMWKSSEKLTPNDLLALEDIICFDEVDQPKSSLSLV